MPGDALQKVRSSLNRGVATISIKTSSTLEKAKIKTHIESLTAEINRLTLSAGETAYSLWEAQELTAEAMEPLLTTIRQRREEIRQLQETYDAIDQRDSQILGTAAAAQTAPAEPGKIICPNCRSEYTNPVKFCRSCGQKLV